MIFEVERGRIFVVEFGMGDLHRISADRLMAVSDLHVDYARNRLWVEELAAGDTATTALLVAGDISHRLALVEQTLGLLADRFAAVFFVPGNHDLWTTDDGLDSLQKMERLEALCRATGVLTGSALIESAHAAVQVVPLTSWYHEPEESDDSLFVGRGGDDPWREAWADYRRVRWPESIGRQGVADYLAAGNLKWRRHHRQVPVVTFSHFVPRRELLRGPLKQPRPAIHEPRHAFNFSRVAGSAAIDRQLRLLDAAVHVYGHQHRNRDQTIDGVRYRAHCLGYPSERDREHITGLEAGPVEIWGGRSGELMDLVAPESSPSS